VRARPGRPQSYPPEGLDRFRLARAKTRAENMQPPIFEH
jgi:hypothetical protein